VADGVSPVMVEVSLTAEVPKPASSAEDGVMFP
jgi:hypothetical protein